MSAAVLPASVLDVHGHVKGEHAAFAAEAPVAYSPRALFSWFATAAGCGRTGTIVATDHLNLATPADPAAIAAARRALELAAEGDCARAALAANVSQASAATVVRAMRRGLRCAIGVEADNDPRTPLGAEEILQRCRPECVVRSVHFLRFEDPNGEGDWMWPFDNPEFSHLYAYYGTQATWERYASTLLDEIERRATDVAGHFYVPAKFGHWPGEDALEAYEDRLIEACARRAIAIEFNTRALYRGAPALREPYLLRYERLLKKASRARVPIALGSDAHDPADQGRGFDLALELVARTGGIDLYSPAAPAVMRA